MSQLARLHREFEDVTGLSKHLNQALLVTKRVSGRIEPIPDSRRRKEAAGIIADVLRTLLDAKEGDPRYPWIRDSLDELSKEIGRSDAETRSELRASLDRMSEELDLVTSNDLRLLDQVGTVLDQSSAALYRRLIRA
jgi:hypothetical protein